MAFTKKLDANHFKLTDQVVAINRVTKVVKGGKNMSFAALVVVGDATAGVVGYGSGKAKEVPQAIRKGIEAAKKNLLRFRYSALDAYRASLDRRDDIGRDGGIEMIGRDRERHAALAATLRPGAGPATASSRAGAVLRDRLPGAPGRPGGGGPAPAGDRGDRRPR